jgi:hypothetical protein
MSPGDAKSLGEMLSRLRLDGDDHPMLRLPLTLASKIEIKDEGCWMWLASRNKDGYGRSTSSEASRGRYAHRVIYELLVGPIPEGLTLDHLCRVTSCVNPAHLEPVTWIKNVRRRPLKTHCPQGHWLEGDNLVVQTGGIRRCRICLGLTYKKRWLRKKEMAT